jgi:hypothetical protein
MASPRPPFRLATRGARFWRQTHASFELSAGETHLLAEICRVLDEIDAMASIVAESGFMSVGSAGQPVEHPAVGGLRSHRVLLANLLKRLALPTEDEAPHAQTGTQRKAARAAHSRWRQTKAREAG